jgi:hypothetical protein
MRVSSAYKPYPVLEGQEFATTLTNLRGSMKADAPSQVKEAYVAVLEPLVEALQQHTPELIGSTRKGNERAYLIGLGDRAFTVAFVDNNEGQTIHAFAPVSRKHIDHDQLAHASGAKQADPWARRPGWEQGRPLDSFLRACNLDRDSAMVTLRISGNDVEMAMGDNKLGAPPAAFSFADLVQLLTRNARKPVARVEEKKSLLGSIMGATGLGGGNGPRELPVGQVLRKLAQGSMQGTPAIRLPMGVADQLSAVAVWRERVVVLTTQGTEDGRTRLWIEDALNGEAFFREIATPKDLPTSGVSMVLKGDDLHLMGGMSDKGKASAATFSYPLHTGSLWGFGGHLWRNDAQLEGAAAWSSPAIVEGEMHLIEGITRFAKDNEIPLAPMTRRGTLKRTNMSWLKKSEAPADLANASIATERQCMVVGPGNALDGRMFVCDTAHDGNWFALPALPKEVGLGQVTLSDGVVFYSGGFEVGGKPSKDIYALDLNSMSGRWERVGESSYVQGTARLVRRSGKLVSMMVTPAGSCLWHLD